MGTHWLCLYPFRWHPTIVNWPVSFSWYCQKLCEPIAAIRSNPMSFSRLCGKSWNTMLSHRFDFVGSMHSSRHASRLHDRLWRTFRQDCLAKRMVSSVRSRWRLDVEWMFAQYCRSCSRNLKSITQWQCYRDERNQWDQKLLTGMWTEAAISRIEFAATCRCGPIEIVVQPTRCWPCNKWCFWCFACDENLRR